MKISADGRQGLPKVLLHIELVTPDKGEYVSQEVRIHTFPLFRFERTGDEVLSRLPPAVDALRASDVRCRSLVRPSLGRNLSSEVMLGVADMSDLGMDALGIACSRNTNVIMAWAWML